MRIKILLLGDNPASLATDSQLLREHGLMVFTTFNLQNLDELVSEINPDVLFFDPLESCGLNAAYNNVINDSSFNNLPIIFTLAEDDLYLVKRKRTEAAEKQNVIADNIIDAIKAALHTDSTYSKKILNTIPHPDISTPHYPMRA